MKQENEMLILASRSPRRKKILEELGLTFEIHVPDCEEVLYAEDSRRTAEENAVIKADWIIAKQPDVTSIAADTVVDFDGRCVLKPKDLAEAKSFLRMFSGCVQTVFTGIAFHRPGKELQVTVAESKVYFRALDDETIEKYIIHVNPLDKAGGYDIDQNGDMIIEWIEGSRTNVMGLPAEVVSDWLGLAQP